MAGLDGVKNRIDPGQPLDDLDIYELDLLRWSAGATVAQTAWR